MQRVKLGLVCLSWLVLASAVSAQTAVDPNAGAGFASVDNFSGGGVLDGTYFDVRHVVGDGVGYTNSYSQVGTFTPFWLNEDAFIAPNARMIVTNSQQVGGSIGGVGRWYSESWDRILGAYGYYDNDQNALNNRYTQATIGAETLGQWWDARINGYFQTGNNTNFVAALGVGGLPFYSGHSIIFQGQSLMDGSLGGGDAEFGVPVSPYAQWLRAYTGAYAYRTGTSSTWGYRARAEAAVSNDLSLGVIVSQDALYGTNVNLTVDFKFSGFQPTRYFPNMTTKQRMLNPVQRNWRVATHTFTQATPIQAINPLTNQPYYITHVNNAAAAGGNGTSEHPFNFLPSSAPGDIILVHRGTSTAATPVLGSLTMADNQRLLGDGILSQVTLSARYGPNSIFGNFNLPGTSNSGLYPFVSSSGNIVTLANNNEVAGLNLLNAGGSAITNTGAGSRNFNLHNLEIAGNADRGISLINASGAGIISNINVGVADHANPLGLGNNTNGGIFVASGGPGLGLQLSNVYMNSSPAGSQAFGVSLLANNGSLNSFFNNVFTNGNGTGISLSETSQQLSAQMNTVRANNNTGVGIQVSGTGGGITIVGNNVAAMKNGSDNLQIGSKAAPIVTSTVGVQMTDANFSGSKGGSGVTFSQSGGQGTIYLTNTNASGNAVDGLGMFGTNGTVMNANVLNGQFQNNVEDAFHVEGTMASTMNLFVDPTNGSGSGRDGLFYSLGQDSLANITFLNDNLNNSGRSAVHGDITNNATVNLFMDNTTGRNSGGDGFYLNASNNSFANMEVDHGTFANAGRLIGGSSAINIISDSSRINLLTNLTLGNNINPSNAIGNQAYGIKLNVSNNSVFNGAVENGDFSNALVDAVNVSALSGSNASLTLFNTANNGSGFHGFVANVDNAQLATSFTNSNINGSGRDGMHFTVANGGVMTSNFDNSTINGSTGSGIYGIVTGSASVANINLDNHSNINNSGNSGVDVNVNAGSLNVAATSSSLSNNGLAGVTGDGVLGTVSNTGVLRLNMNNVTINNNLDNGIFVTTRTGSSVQAAVNLGSINNNGRAGMTLHNNDGIRLDMDGSPASSLQVINGTTINGNGNDGISLLATNGTNFAGVFNGITILNNGFAPPPFVGTRAGFNVVAETNSTMNMSLTAMTIGNTLPFGTQQVGFLSQTNTSATVNAAMTSVNLSNNSANAINSTVTTNSATNLDLTHVTANNSGITGALFNVLSGGQLNVFSSVASSISNSGGQGILTLVDGTNSIANFDLDGISVSNNGAFFGGQGFNGIVSGGANLNAVILNASINSNANQGIALNVGDANSVANFHVGSSTVNNNGSEGLVIQAANQGVVNYRSVGTTYNTNGSNGTFDGVTLTAIGTGAADSAIIRTLFANGSIDGNTGNGMNLDAVNGATMTTSIQNMSISNNGSFGIQANGSGANTEFNLLMSGTNPMTNNGAGSISPLVFNGLNQVVLQLAGNFNGNAGDGLHVDVQNSANALIAVNGPGTMDGNGGNGISVNLQNITNGSLLIDGITTISNNASDGIRVNFDTVANAALGIEGPTTLSGNGANGIGITVTNSILANNMSYGPADIEVLTLTDNLATPLSNQLPVPVTVSLDGLGLTSTKALVVDGMTVTSSGLSGVDIAATNTTISTNGSFITNNAISSSRTLDGIHLNFNTVTADGMLIASNGLQGNGANGLNLDLFNTPMDGLTIIGNTGGPTFQAGTLDFTFNNLIWTTFMNNNSSAGLNIANVSLDLSSAIQTQVWRPDLTPFVTPPGFEPTAPTDVTVGLISVDGNPIAPGNYPVTDPSGTPLPNGGVPIGSSVLNLGFNNFTPGSQLEYSLAHGPSAGSTLLDGSTFTGATGTVTLADGRSASAVFDSTGLHVNQVFGGVSSGISGNGGDGIRFNLNNSSLTNLNVSNNQLIANGGATTGHGIEFTGVGGAVVNSDITNATIANNSITNNTGDGIHLVNPTTLTNTISMAITSNNISQNRGAGVNLSLVTGGQDLNASFKGNVISSNVTGPGINIHLADNANMTGGFDTNTINSNGQQGINFNMGVNGHVTSNFTDNVINGNAGDGINIALNTGGQFNSAVFTGNTIGTTASRNGGMGVHLTVPDLASFNWNLGDTTQNANLITGNAGAGVGIVMSGASSGTLNVANTSFSNTVSGAIFTGDGLSVDEGGSAVVTGTIVASQFNNNAHDGAFFNVTGNNVGVFAVLNNLTVGQLAAGLGNSFNNNGGNGLEFFRIADGEINNTKINNNTFNQNTQNGLVIRSANKFFTDTYDVNSNTMSNNGLNGVLLDQEADANISVNMDLNTITNNGRNGILLTEKINSGTDLRALTGTWTQNVITGNQFNGIALDGALNNLIIGDPVDTNLGNLISSNARNGIEVSGTGSATIGSNVISLNGTLANLGTVNENAGLMLSVSPNSSLTVENNLINNNRGDGIQYGISNGTTINGSGGSTTSWNGFSSSVTINDNVIINNDGRGIDLINRGFNFTNADIFNNRIVANRLEGLYVVNTASTSQNQFNSSSAALAQDGSVFAQPVLNLRVVNNQIQGNGINSPLTGTGLVVRVGTSDGGNGIFDNGGFASTGAAIAANASSATFFGTVVNLRGGVVAQIDSNILGGNFGSDVLFHSFTSTADPVVSGGTWSDTQFTVTAYQSDPLSRFDLYFRNNITDPGSFDMVGTGLGGFASRNNDLVAFYNNAEGVFKSRLNNITPATNAGPFNVATRARNATRLAARIPFFTAPNDGSDPGVLYPGMGASTWRVSNDSQLGFFNLDNTPYTNTFDANGNFLNGIGNNGEQPYGWGQF